jgi:phosphate acetyltransferase/phosphate butyryltransferase
MTLFEGTQQKESRIMTDKDAPLDRFARLEESAARLENVPVAVVWPVDAPSLRGALESTQANLIAPVLVGPKERICAVAKEEGLSIDMFEIVAASTPEDAAQKAVEMAVSGQVRGLMKGALHTNTLMHAFVMEKAMRTGRRMSHVFVIDVPDYDRLLFVSDAALNVRPDLKCLRDIVRNAINLTHALGIDRPKVALLSATENIDEEIESTIFAAAICKMADRGTIKGADIDGPLAMDLAVSSRAVRIKGIKSKVAGQADVLIVPDLVSGNILAKNLDYLANAEAAGIVMGGAVPIALTSRADTASERRASAALLSIVAAARTDMPS